MPTAVTATKRSPDFRVIVTWIEITRRDGKAVRLSYSKTYCQTTLDDARAFRARALQNNGWAPETAHEVEIELGGLDAPMPQQQGCSLESFRTGMAMVRAALANASGPLAKDLGRAVTRGVDRKSQAAGERVAS